MSKKGLTAKQESFARAYVENGGNASEAYRSAYNAENMKQETIHSKACLLLKQDNVTARVKELQEEAQKIADKEFEITIKEVTKNLIRLSKGAEADRQFSPAIKAQELLGKHLGMFGKDIEIAVNIGDSITEKIKIANERRRDNDSSPDMDG